MADEFTKAILHGNIEAILAKKKPVAMEQITVPQPGSPLKCVLVEGAPGMGKSTFAWELCHKWDEIDCMHRQFSLVVLVRLREKTAQEATCLTDLFIPDPSVDM